MVLQGRVFPGDVIRLGTSGEWFPASSVEGLFPKTPAPVATQPETQDQAEKVENARKIPESELVIQGIERLYRASELAASELAEKAMKEGTSADKNKVVGASTSPSASRQAADKIIKNYSQFAITSAERKKQEELASRVPLSVQIRENWVKIVIGAVGVILFISILLLISTSLAPA
jgi:hypothetical protein